MTAVMALCYIKLGFGKFDLDPKKFDLASIRSGKKFELDQEKAAKKKTKETEGQPLRWAIARQHWQLA